MTKVLSTESCPRCLVCFAPALQQVELPNGGLIRKGVKYAGFCGVLTNKSPGQQEHQTAVGFTNDALIGISEEFKLSAFEVCNGEMHVSERQCDGVI